MNVRLLRVEARSTGRLRAHTRLRAHMLYTVSHVTAHHSQCVRTHRLITGTSNQGAHLSFFTAHAPNACACQASRHTSRINRNARLRHAKITMQDQPRKRTHAHTHTTTTHARGTAMLESYVGIASQVQGRTCRSAPCIAWPELTGVTRLPTDRRGDVEARARGCFAQTTAGAR